jgi:hypothetical protein
MIRVKSFFNLNLYKNLNRGFKQIKSNIFTLPNKKYSIENKKDLLDYRSNVRKTLMNSLANEKIEPEKSFQDKRTQTATGKKTYNSMFKNEKNTNMIIKKEDYANNIRLKGIFERDPNDNESKYFLILIY